MTGMILYALAATIVFGALAKRGRGKRRMGKYIRGAVDEELTLTTLAAKTVVSAVFDSVVNERTLVSSIVATWSLRSFTPATDDGPILVGLAHSDYTDVEIEEYIETTGAWDEGNMKEQEVSKRKIRRIGVFDTPDSATDSVVLNDGRPIKIKLNWILVQAQTVRVWAYNLGSSALATTAPIVTVSGHVNLWPR